MLQITILQRLPMLPADRARLDDIDSDHAAYLADPNRVLKPAEAKHMAGRKSGTAAWRAARGENGEKKAQMGKRGQGSDPQPRRATTAVRRRPSSGDRDQAADTSIAIDDLRLSDEAELQAIRAHYRSRQPCESFTKIEMRDSG